MKSDSRLPRALFVVLVFVGFLQTRHTAMTLPPVLAIHFVNGGAPNGWQTQSQFFVLGLILLGVCMLVAIWDSADHRGDSPGAGERAEQGHIGSRQNGGKRR